MDLHAKGAESEAPIQGHFSTSMGLASIFKTNSLKRRPDHSRLPIPGVIQPENPMASQTSGVLERG
jgi:hypothetical protein